MTKPRLPVTRNCAAGNHVRCLGTVHAPTGIIACECAVVDCGHGSDTAKARRRETLIPGTH